MLKVVSKKLEASWRKTSREWARYRREKRKVIARKRMPSDLKKQVIQSELDLARQRISNNWTTYREDKYAIIHKSPYRDFKFVRKLTGVKKEVEGEKHFFRFHDSYQKIYKAKRGFNTDRLDDVVPKVLRDPKVKGVLVVFEVDSAETGQRQHVSNYINKELMDIIEERGETVFEYVSKRFQAGDTKDYNLKFIYMRIVYEKS